MAKSVDSENFTSQPHHESEQVLCSHFPEKEAGKM